MSNGADQLGLLLAFIVSVALIGAVVYGALTYFLISLGVLAFIGGFAAAWLFLDWAMRT